MIPALYVALNGACGRDFSPRQMENRSWSLGQRPGAPCAIGKPRRISMRKPILTSLCALSLLALGCKDPVVKNEMDKAAAEMKEAGHETAEAARAAGRATEAAAREAADDVKQETKHLEESATGSAPETAPDVK
jgi:hypothetical protein